MPREISIHKCDIEILKKEFQFIIDYIQQFGQSSCELVFGWHWGLKYPEGRPWGTNVVAVNDVADEIIKPEEAGLGQLGRDDIIIRFPAIGIEFFFCHHDGIHLKFSHEGRISHEFRCRWSAAGFDPHERECDEPQ